jgi:hypothetical protein
VVNICISVNSGVISELMLKVRKAVPTCCVHSVREISPCFGSNPLFINPNLRCDWSCWGWRHPSCLGRDPKDCGRQSCHATRKPKNGKTKPGNDRQHLTGESEQNGTPRSRTLHTTSQMNHLIFLFLDPKVSKHGCRQVDMVVI